MSKHTSGKWKIKHSETKDSFNIIGDILGGRYKIARCPYPRSVNADLDERERLEALANATLIRTAPEMLEALKWAQSCVPFPSDCHSRIIEVIKKAEL